MHPERFGGSGASDEGMEVCILGGGYAGVVCARRLEQRLPADVDIRLVDETGTHVIQHELHRLIRYPQLADALEIPLDDILGRTAVREARIVDIDLADRSFRTAGGSTHQPDVLVVCIGAETADYGIPGVMEHGYPLKRMREARAIRVAALGASPGKRIVIGGAGLSGVQVAGELAALRSDVDIVLLEQAEHVAPRFDAAFQATVRDRLVAQEIDVRTDRAIHAVHPDRVEIAEGGQDPYDLFVWTGGIAGPRSLGDRPSVRSDLRVASRTFVIGDTARVVDDRGTPVPASAQTAIEQARVTARNIERLVRADRSSDRVFDPRLDRYVTDVPGWVVSVGDDAVAQIGDRVITGAGAHGANVAAGVRYLTSVGRVRESLDLIREELRETPALRRT